MKYPKKQALLFKSSVVITPDYVILNMTMSFQISPIPNLNPSTSSLIHTW